MRNNVMKTSFLFAGLLLAYNVTAQGVPSHPIVQLKVSPVPAAKIDSPITIAVQVKIMSPYHIQGHPPLEGNVETTLTAGPSRFVKLMKVTYPKPVKEKLFGMNTPVYTGSVLVHALLKPLRAGNYKLPLHLHYQACNTQSCLPPEDVSINLNLHVVHAGKRIVHTLHAHTK